MHPLELPSRRSTGTVASHARVLQPAARTAALGDVVVDAFDAAARLSDDPAEVTAMAARSVWRSLRQAHQHARACAVPCNARN